MPVGLALIGIALTGAGLWPGADAAARDLGARDDGQRLRAVLELARLDGPGATALLVPMLADREPNVRLAAARLLARRGAKQATEAAVAWLATSAPRERFLGLLVLRQVPELAPEARRATERALRGGALEARLQALDVLATHPAASSYSAVVGALDDELADVRLRAVHVLEATGDPRATVPLLGHVGDADRSVRDATLAALGALGDRRVLPALLRQLDEGAPEPRTTAVDALAHLGDAAAVPALTTLARRRPRDELARHAALALGTLATPEAVDVLLALAREPPGADDLRLALERAGVHALPRLCRELETGSPTSARLAAEALGAIGDRLATGALVEAARRRSATSLAALAALARLADPAAVPGLARLVETAPVADVRGLALDALIATGDASAVDVLPRALADADAGVRARGVRLAAKLGGGGAAVALAGRLDDPDGDVRREAAVALGGLSALPPEAARAIIVVLARPTPPLDADAAAALGDALERVEAEPPALEQAYLAASLPLARAALARGLAAGRHSPSSAVVSALIRDLAGAPTLALAAADALLDASLSQQQQEALSVAFARAEVFVGARLSPSLARFPSGAAALESTLADDGAAACVRAAAAWALASRLDARAALERATDDAAAAIAANARGALASQARAGRRATSMWTAVRLTTPDGAPWPARWVTVTAGDDAPVWAMTDLEGRAVVAGLGAGPLRLGVPPE
jgi:HEAT repeat protein